ncbi:hypothetical protein BC830DRAFT_1151399 [Chytriomyces sp. MP71]|nr:hypothetical protein BC830DRAFT_1151399 [Chytriomyces sp. MP71]
MARQSRSTASSTTRAPARAAPAAAPPQSQPQQAQSVPANYSAPAPVPVAAQPQQPSLFANMASTAAGVAVGSAVGHTLGAGLTSWFGGGSSSQPQQQAAPAQPMQAQGQPFQGNVCEADSKAFTACLEKSSNDISACQFYLDMLKQ